MNSKCNIKPHLFARLLSMPIWAGISNLCEATLQLAYLLLVREATFAKLPYNLCSYFYKNS